MSDSPVGARPRATLPLGVGPFPSSAFRRAARADRATVGPPADVEPEPEPPQPAPEWECFGLDSEPGPAAVEPCRRAQLPGDMALAPRSPVLRAPVRLRGRWPAPSPARLALARFSDGPVGRTAKGALVVVAGALVIVALAVNLRARGPELRQPRQKPELRADVAPGGRTAAPMSAAPSSPDHAPPAVPMSPAASARPAGYAPRAAPGSPRAAPGTRTSGAARTTSTSDVLDPWRQ